jgi:hypothetical protein
VTDGVSWRQPLTFAASTGESKGECGAMFFTELARALEERGF